MAALTSLDQTLTELAGLLHQASPLQDWQRQELDVRYAPDGGVSAHDYVYVLKDGRRDQSVSPEDAAVRAAIRDLTYRHWELSQQAGGARWSRMQVWVERAGRFGADFEYSADYSVGDIARRV